ncbi:WD repeat-containing protein on Y chromosome [Pseudolycoriella hygida]|uniref:WD repeat-containing protein on Y chromosome n=1 Tax=Pseudolycoriella hygida TaxID=35572 RepID=A0A9Q0NA91_9DIPT|nr:WD repeat-containing protein on Y chromosome [Pseudolycoriella hygida]
MLSSQINSSHIYGQPLSQPILGKNFQLPYRHHLRGKLILDTRLSYIPVYRYLYCHHLSKIERPPTPLTLTIRKSNLNSHGVN